MAKQHMMSQPVDGASLTRSQQTQRAFVQRASMAAFRRRVDGALLSLMTNDVRRRFRTHECCLKGLRRLAVGHGIDEAAPRCVWGGEVEHVREEAFEMASV